MAYGDLPLSERSRRRAALAAVLLGVLGGGGCLRPSGPAAEPERFSIRAQPWPEAEASFRSDAAWLGGDGVYSVDLGDERVLWLFGDSFVGTGPARVRSEARLVRNSVAIQAGYDPSEASVAFYWGRKEGAPGSFFPDRADRWYWPGHGILLDQVLLLFLMEVRGTEGGLGFAVTGWTAVRIDNPAAPPGAWNVRWLETPANPYRVIVGSASVLRDGEYVYAFGTQETTAHDAYLVRWPVSKAKQGDLEGPEWWTGEHTGWIRQEDPAAKPEAVLPAAQTEFTVHYEPALRRYLQVQTEGFGGADLVFRTAKVLTGPWSSKQQCYRPGESDRPGILVYQGKAHPSLRGGGLVMTYSVNTLDFATLVADTAIYFPKFLRGTVE